MLASYLLLCWCIWYDYDRDYDIMNDEELTHHVVHEVNLSPVVHEGSQSISCCAWSQSISCVVHESQSICNKRSVWFACVRACILITVSSQGILLAEKRIIIIMPAEILYRRMDKSGLCSNSILMSDVVLASIIESVYTSISTKAAAVLLLVSAWLV